MRFNTRTGGGLRITPSEGGHIMSPPIDLGSYFAWLFRQGVIRFRLKSIVLGYTGHQNWKKNTILSKIVFRE